MRIDHISFVVRDLERALRVWKALGLQVGPIEEFDSEDSREAYIQTAPARILLQQPRSEKSPLGKYLLSRQVEPHSPLTPALRRPIDIHHIAVVVPSIRAAIRNLRGKGWLLTPSTLDSLDRGGPAWLVTNAGGLLVEMMEGDATAPPEGSLEHVCLNALTLSLLRRALSGLGVQYGRPEADHRSGIVLTRFDLGGVEFCGRVETADWTPFLRHNRRSFTLFNHLKLRIPPPMGLRLWKRQGACFVHPRESEGILIELDPAAR